MKHYKIMLGLHFHAQNDCVIWIQISNSKYIIIIVIIIVTIMCCVRIFLSNPKWTAQSLQGLHALDSTF